jgi:16S rRNA (uracil1498-N3)-methyltransferase
MTLAMFVSPAVAEASVGDVLTLDGEEGRHASVVRRIALGEEITLGDGSGTVARCRVASVGKGSLTVSVLEVDTRPVEMPRVVVVQAIPKGERGELAVEMLTEVGADVIVPWAAARSIARWKGERADKSLAKWRSAAREAAKQARRAWFPTVSPLAGTDEVVALLANASVRVVLHEAASGPLADVPVPGRGEIVIVVGPEGGITADELAAFAAVGAEPLRLGSSVLRSSTAGVAAAAALLSRTPRWR